MAKYMREQKLVKKSIFSSKTSSAERTEDLQETAWFKPRTVNSEFFDAVKIVNGQANCGARHPLGSHLCVSSATTAPQHRERERERERKRKRRGQAEGEGARRRSRLCSERQSSARGGMTHTHYTDQTRNACLAPIPCCCGLGH